MVADAFYFRNTDRDFGGLEHGEGWISDGELASMFRADVIDS